MPLVLPRTPSVRLSGSRLSAIPLRPSTKIPSPGRVGSHRLPKVLLRAPRSLLLTVAPPGGLASSKLIEALIGRLVADNRSEPVRTLDFALLGAYQVAAEVVGAVVGAAVEVPVDQAP